MPSPSQEIIQLLSVFAKAFTVPTFANALMLLYGTILAPGRRTVAAAPRATGLANIRHFTSYHRVLNRARGPCRLYGSCPGTEDKCQAPETTSNADGLGHAHGGQGTTLAARS